MRVHDCAVLTLGRAATKEQSMVGVPSSEEASGVVAFPISRCLLFSQTLVLPKPSRLCNSRLDRPDGGGRGLADVGIVCEAPEWFDSGTATELAECHHNLATQVEIEASD